MNQNKSSSPFEFIINEDLAGKRIDKALSTHDLIKTRSRAGHLIDSGLVQLNGKAVKSSNLTKLNEVYLILLPAQATNAPLEPYDFKLDIFFEDDDILVVNKPSGLVVHPSLGHSSKTLVNALVKHTPNLSMGFNETRPGIVHRLDKETSGLLVVSKNDFAHEALAKQFKSRAVHRVYWAIVYGTPRAPSKKISSQLGRHPTQRKKFASVEEGKIAITNYEILKPSNKGLTHLKIKLETGRTHQIRVHLSELAHPVIGDNLYGSTRRIQSIKNSELANEIKSMTRIGLHAKELGFIHPTTNKEMFFDSSWPEDLLKIVTLCEF